MASLVALTLLVGLLIAVAALAAERFVIMRRGAPVRWVWLVAMMLPIGLPIVRLVATVDTRAVSAAEAVAPLSGLPQPVRSADTAAQSVAPAALARPSLGSRVAALLETPFVLPAVSPAIERTLSRALGRRIRHVGAGRPR